MSNAKMILDEHTFKALPDEEKLWLIFKNYGLLDNRLKTLENRKLWNGAKSFAGGLIGGAAAAIGMIWGGIK